MLEPDGTTEQDKIEDALVHEHIRNLVAQLTCGNVTACQKARRDLVALGKPALPALIGALSNPDQRVRWEAAKALGQIGDPAAAPALIKALEDKEFDVRWLAAEGLIAIGRPALRTLLEALVKHAGSVWLRENAYRVLESMLGSDVDDIILPVLNSLSGPESAVHAPAVARSALEQLIRQ